MSRPTSETFLVLAVGADGALDFYPHGSGQALLDGLRRAMDLLRDRPELLRCATGTCNGSCGHGARKVLPC